MRPPSRPTPPAASHVQSRVPPSVSKSRAPNGPVHGRQRTSQSSVALRHAISACPLVAPPAFVLAGPAPLPRPDRWTGETAGCMDREVFPPDDERAPTQRGPVGNRGAAARIDDVDVPLRQFERTWTHARIRHRRPPRLTTVLTRRGAEVTPRRGRSALSSPRNTCSSAETNPALTPDVQTGIPSNTRVAV